MTVTVYTKPACAGCVATQRHMAKLGIEFTPKPIDDEILSIAEMAGITAAPIVRVAENDGSGSAYYWGGYRPDRIDALVS